MFKAGESTPGLSAFPVDLPCGQCIGCRLEYARNWACRCLCEMQMHEKNCFVTLTYDAEHMPLDGELHHRDVQLFMKKVRKKYGGSIKYFMAGEYGSEYGRPHYHVLLFGVDFPDRVYLKTTWSGSRLDTSEQLSELWEKGFVSVGDVTFESAGYVARYTLKKLECGVLNKRFEENGKVYDVVVKNGVIRTPEYVRMSRGGRGGKGLGWSWLQKFKSDVFPHGYMVMRGGIRMPPPRYFDNEYELENPLDMKRLKMLRSAGVGESEDVWNDMLKKWQRLKKFRGDRLEVMEEVKERQLSVCRRKVESGQ